MAGGLIQLSVYGSQDVFLTGTPQITFFKIIYRRYTNFSIETISRSLTNFNFGEKTYHTIEKIGDLLSNIRIEFDVPSVKITQEMVGYNDDYILNLQVIEKIYNLTKQYILDNIDYIRNGDDIKDRKENIINNKENLINYIKNNIEMINIIFPNILLSDWIIDISIIDASRKKVNSLYYSHVRNFFEKISKIYNKIKSIGKNSDNLSDVNFAWVEELGTSIIDKINIIIGNNVIDTHTGDWMTIYNKLYLSSNQLPNYYRSIGNIIELTSPTINPKPRRKIIIPLNFWFCRNIGISIPLIALKYQNIDIDIALRNISSVLWINNPGIKPSDLNLKLENPKILIDYIYLSNDERQRFAKSSHEYLIETLQYCDFTEKMPKSCQIHLNFIHPVKFVTWFSQPAHRRYNIDGNHKIQWNNYGVNLDKTGQTMDFSYLKLNSYNRTDPGLESVYYNYVQPYYHFEHSPTDGLYTYSFAIHPMMHQPSSSINLSRIDDFSLNIKFNQKFMESITLENDEYNLSNYIYLGVYSIAYNILRFASGMAGLCFVSSSKE